MSTDSTPSTTNSTAKRLREYINEDIWTLFESKERKIRQVQETSTGQITSPPWWIFDLTNGVFLFHVSGGNPELSNPPELQLPFQDYEWLTLELWDYRGSDGRNGGSREAFYTEIFLPRFPRF
jgi:hypothetical protein